MLHPRDSAVITGMGAVSALGTGCTALWHAVAQGQDGLRPIGRFDTSPFVSRLGGLWPTWDERREDEMSADGDLTVMAEKFPLVEMARTAMGEAIEQAKLADRDLDRARIAVVLGTCFGQGFHLFQEVTVALAEAFGFRGPRLTVSTACSSSTNAVGLGRDLLRASRADVVVAGGADVLLREVFAGFCALGVVSPEKCAPFSSPSGISLGEGAGFVVLERAEGRPPDAPPALASVLGYGLSSDGFHETTPDPTGGGLARAIRGALADARLDRSSIDYVNAHATGTESHDRAEWAAIRETLDAGRVAVSASKSYLGHTQGAAGILELIMTVLGMRRGLVPPTLHFRGARPGCPEDPIADVAPRPLSIAHALDVSAAFGGANAVLAIGAPSVTARPDSAARPDGERVVVVRGLGAIGPQGAGVEALAAASRRGSRIEGDVVEFDLTQILNNADPRRLDRSSRLLTAATALALGDAGVKVRGALRDQVGLFLGATRMPAESSIKCMESLERHGVTGCSAAAFARMSVNAPAGACAKLLGLRGPGSTVCAGQASGLLAILLGAEWLALRDDAELMLAGGLDERLPVAARQRRQAAAYPATDGAACALLAREPAEASSGPISGRVIVAGWGVAGPGEGLAAARIALSGRPAAWVWGDGTAARASVPDAPGFVDVTETWGGGQACGSAVAFLLAAHAVRTGQIGRALVLSASDASVSCAILLEMRAQMRREAAS